MDYAKSTRVSIVQQGLTDVFERLSEMPPSDRVKELKARADAIDKAVRDWETQPPSEEQRKTMTKSVLDLNVEVISASKESSA